MNRRAAHADGGFVLLDALMATALVAFAGGAIIAIADTILDQQGNELDRSVGLVMSQSLMQLLLLAGNSVPEREDELFRYEIVVMGAVEGTSALRAMAVVAEPKTGNVDSAVRLEFLAPAASP